MLDYFNVYLLQGLKVVGPVLIVLAVCKILKF